MRRAFTLIEVVVVAALLALLGGLFVKVLIPTLDITVRRSARIELQQNATMLLARIAREIGASTPAGLTLAPGALSIHALSDIDSDGNQLWRKHVTVYAYRPERRQVVRFTRDASSTLAPSPLAPDLLATASDPQERAVARYVTDFRLTQPGLLSTGFELPIEVHLALELPPARPGAPVETLSVSRKFFTLNSTF